MTMQPIEPLPIVVNCKEQEKSWILEIQKNNHPIYVRLDQPSFQTIEGSDFLLPPKKAQIYAKDKKDSFVFLETIADWLGMEKYLKTGQNPLKNVDCGYELLTKGPDAHDNTVISMHFLLRSNKMSAGLHLQYIPKSGAGYLFESHMGSPKELILLLEATLN